MGIMEAPPYQSGQSQTEKTCINQSARAGLSSNSNFLGKFCYRLIHFKLFFYHWIFGVFFCGNTPRRDKEKVDSK